MKFIIDAVSPAASNLLALEPDRILAVYERVCIEDLHLPLEGGTRVPIRLPDGRTEWVATSRPAVTLAPVTGRWGRIEVSVSPLGLMLGGGDTPAFREKVVRAFNRLYGGALEGSSCHWED